MEIEFTCADEAMLKSRMGISTIFILNRLTGYVVWAVQQEWWIRNYTNMLVEGNVGLSEEIG